jgi:hypothetical protein
VSIRDVLLEVAAVVEALPVAAGPAYSLVREMDQLEGEARSRAFALEVVGREGPTVTGRLGRIAYTAALAVAWAPSGGGDAFEDEAALVAEGERIAWALEGLSLSSGAACLVGRVSFDYDRYTAVVELTLELPATGGA